MRQTSFQSYKQHAVADTWDVIVIGSGIGGLTTAALLAKEAKKRVLVLERHYTAGGYTHTFRRPGYQWDVGVHYVGQVQDRSSPVRAAFDYLTAGELEWAPLPDVYDRVILDGNSYDFVSGKERLRERLKAYFPPEARAIDEYFRSVDRCLRWSSLFYAEKIVPEFLARGAGGLMRAPWIAWAGRTTAEVLSGITSNRELSAVLTGQWGDYGLPPARSCFAAHATVAAHYFEGASYPIGGSARILDAMAPPIHEAGGSILASAEVREIVVRNQSAAGVRMADGNVFSAPVVVSDAGAVNTFRTLLPAGVSPFADQLRELPSSMAYLCLYIGAEARPSELGLEGTNLWVHPTNDHDLNMERFANDPQAPFPFVYISFPAAKDPDWERRHPGRSTVEAIAPVPYEWFRRWEETRWKHRGEEYDEFKKTLASRLQAATEKHVPGLRGRIAYAELSSPLSTRHFANYANGEAYGVAATPDRFRARWLKPRTPVNGLYLTGQDVSMLGVTGALFGGAIAASAILGRNLVSTLTRRK